MEWCMESAYGNSFSQNSKVLTAPYREFLGSASPANYQRIIEEVLVNNNYHIESFDNSQTGAFIFSAISSKSIFLINSVYKGCSSNEYEINSFNCSIK